MPLWLNAVCFQTAWFVAVLGQVPWGWCAIVWPLAHLYLVSDRRIELQFILSVMLIGVVVDTLLVQLGVFVFPTTPGFIPLWLVVLWSAFPTTLRHSLSWLYRNNLLAAAFGAVGGTISYLAGYRFGAVELPLGVWATVGVLAPLWAILLVAFGYLSRALDRMHAKTLPGQS